MVELIGGTDTYCIYGEETTFGTAVAATAQFGSVENVSVRKTRNIQEIHGAADGTTTGQLPRTHLKGKYESNVSITFKPVVWAHLEYVLGAVSGSGTGASPYSYTHARVTPSLTIRHNFNQPSGTDSQRSHRGCVCTSYQMRFTEGQAVTCTMEFLSNAPTGSTTVDSNVAIASGAEYNFDGGSIEAPDGSALTHVFESGTVSISREVKFFYGFSETAVSFIMGKTTIRLQLSVKYKDDTFWTNFIGQQTTLTTLASYATIALKFTNGATKYVDFVFSNCTLATHDDNDQLNQEITEDLVFYARGLTVGERVTT